MTDEYAKSLLSELMKISENMATKADIQLMQQNLGDGIQALLNRSMSAMMQPPDQSCDKETHEAWMEVKDAEIARLSDRVDTISGRLLDRIENIEKAPRLDIVQLEKRVDKLQIDLTDILFMLRDHEKRLRNLQAEKLLRSTETGETRTRPDTGASKDYSIEREVEYLRKASEEHLKSFGGSGSQPAEPSPETSGTEQPQGLDLQGDFPEYGTKEEPDAL